MWNNIILKNRVLLSKLSCRHLFSSDKNSQSTTYAAYYTQSSLLSQSKYKFPFWLSQGINFVLLNCKQAISWSNDSLSNRITIISWSSLRWLCDGWHFTTAGVVSGTVPTPSLVNVHVACIYPWNNTTICTLMSLVLWVLCTINIVFQIRPFVSNLFDKNLQYAG